MGRLIRCQLYVILHSKGALLLLAVSLVLCWVFLNDGGDAVRDVPSMEKEIEERAERDFDYLGMVKSHADLEDVADLEERGKALEGKMTGVLNLDKPAGWTSHDAVAKLRRILGERRIGHGGTLDPMATGVLPVFVGRATRAVEFLEAADKEYEAGLRLGIITEGSTSALWRSCARR